jgi:hypothetical protein
LTRLQVCEEEEESAELEVLDILAAKAKEGVGIKVDLGAIAGIQQLNNADNDGDGKVDMRELEAIMGDDIKVVTRCVMRRVHLQCASLICLTPGGVPGKIKQRYNCRSRSLVFFSVYRHTSPRNQK